MKSIKQQQKERNASLGGVGGRQCWAGIGLKGE
jgi:hypothetical protein